ncbi:MAG: hypothetical protein ACRDZQ_12945 [Acidimicrobiales bacterium]
MKGKPAIGAKGVERLLGPLARRGLRRGLLGGDRAWIAVWVGVTLLRRLRRPGADLVYSERLHPGESVVVAHQPATPSRRARRRAARELPGEERSAREGAAPGSGEPGAAEPA